MRRMTADLCLIRGHPPHPRSYSDLSDTSFSNKLPSVGS
jgi:hypothetical protein